MKDKPTKPISVKNMSDYNFNTDVQKFIGNILFNKNIIVKQAVIKELNIKESQFETILRKDAKKFTLAILASKEGSLMTEQYFFEGKYLFTLDVSYKNIYGKLESTDIFESPTSISVEYIIKKDIGEDIVELRSGIESIELVKKEDETKS